MTEGAQDLTADDVRALLVELGRRLQARGVQGHLYVVGGAAIALQVDARRVTMDIDAVLHPEVSVRAEAEAMSAEHGLPRGWLNSSAAAFVPGDDGAAVVLDVPGLAVALASPEHLLAMKMAAYRPGQDQEDLELLFRELDVHRAEEAADIALRVYGDDTVVLPGREELLLSAQAVIERMAGPGGHGR